LAGRGLTFNHDCCNNNTTDLTLSIGKFEEVMKMNKFKNGRLADDGLEKYLESIDFDKRLKKGRYFSNQEFREFLMKNLKKYFQNQVSQDFIIGLGSTIYPEAMTSMDKKDDALLTAVCMIEDLVYDKPKKTTEERKEILRSALKILERQLLKQA